MTDAEVLRELGSDTLLNAVRRIISGYAGKAEQDLSSRRLKAPMQLRREEFEVAQKIISVVRERP